MTKTGQEVQETGVIYASTFGNKDFSEAFESKASGKLADAYRDLVQDNCCLGYRDGTDSEVDMKDVAEELDNILDIDRIAQKILETPVYDALSNWRTVEGAEDKDDDGLSDRDEALEMSEVFQQATIQARTLGCAIIYPILKDDKGKLVSGSRTLQSLIDSDGTYIIDKLYVPEKNVKFSGPLETNFYLNSFGFPTKLSIGDVKVHPSRVIFVGKWNGKSYFGSIRSDLADYHEARRRLHIASRKNDSMTLETDVGELQSQLQAVRQATGDGSLPTVEECLTFRARALYQNLNDVNVAVINKGEALHHNEKSNIKDLVENVVQQSRILSAVADMPYSRLFIRMVGGLSSGDQTEFENYSQALHSLRATYVNRPLNLLDRFIADVTRSSIVKYKWNDTKAEQVRLNLAGQASTEDTPDTEEAGD